MPFPTISPIPAPPTISDPGGFPAQAQAFLAAFPTMRSQFNAGGVYLDDSLAAVDADATAAAASAGTATTQAGTATTQAGIATTQAGTATTQAGIATTQAGIATTQAAIATAVFSGLMGRNLIINGSGRINQRAYVSGVPTTVANQFTLDRWFVLTSGQNITFTGGDAGRTMTAPAGGAAQVIEGANIFSGTYVINWTGTATCTVGGIARAKNDTFTLSTNTNTTVVFTDGTFRNVQIELGTVSTVFEQVDFGLELMRCQRYHETGGLFMQGGTSGFNYGSGLQFAATKRATPTMSGSVATATNTTGVAFQSIRVTGFGINAAASASGASVTWNWAATSELTS